jgi:YggT family protein
MTVIAATVFVEATARSTIADYVSTLAYVYGLVIFAYIALNWLFAFGVRIPYSRWSDAILTFLRDVTEPYLRIFRRLLPSLGGLDLSPILALAVLYVVASVVSNAIRG